MPDSGRGPAPGEPDLPDGAGASAAEHPGAVSRVCEREHELRSARRAGSVAARHEVLAAEAPASIRGLHMRMAALHRQTERRHLITASLYDSLVAKVLACPDVADGADLDSRLPLMAAAAEFAGSAGAIITLFDSHQNEVLVLASDRSARRAHDIEFGVGEGPSREAFRTRQIVAASGQEMSRRWKLYGPRAASLDVRAVAAAPMTLDAACLGSLVLLNPAQVSSSEAIGAVSEALAHALIEGKLGGRAGILAQATDHLPFIHQAVGVVSARTGCSVGDALALIRARAFAESAEVCDIARGILCGSQDMR